MKPLCLFKCTYLWRTYQRLISLIRKYLFWKNSNTCLLQVRGTICTVHIKINLDVNVMTDSPDQTVTSVRNTHSPNLILFFDDIEQSKIRLNYGQRITYVFIGLLAQMCSKTYDMSKLRFIHQMWICTMKIYIGAIREQWYYNNGLQEVMTSIYFVKIKTIFLPNSLDSNPGQQVLLRSSV